MWVKVIIKQFLKLIPCEKGPVPCEKEEVIEIFAVTCEKEEVI